MANIRLVGELAPDDGTTGEAHAEAVSSNLATVDEVLSGESDSNGLLRSSYCRGFGEPVILPLARVSPTSFTATAAERMLLLDGRRRRSQEILVSVETSSNVAESGELGRGAHHAQARCRRCASG